MVEVRIHEPSGLLQPAVLVVAVPLLVGTCAGAALLTGSSWRQAAFVGLLVPWALAGALGLWVIVAALLGPARRDRQSRPVTIDLRDRLRPRVPLPMPRQDRQPLDDVPKRGRGAP